MIRTIAALFLFCAVHTASALDIQAIDPHRWPTNDEESVAYALLFGDETWSYEVKSFAEDFGTENVADMILGFVEPLIDEARVSADSSMKSRLCDSGIYAMGLIGATNALPFLEKTVLHGGRFSKTAFEAYGGITHHDESFIDLGDRAVAKGALDGGYRREQLNFILWDVRDGGKQISPECKLRIAAHIISVPSGHWGTITINDDAFLADFPFYRNSAERLANLTALIENSFTPPEVRAKYEPELKRLKALPPKKLISATERIEAQLANLPETEARKKAIAKIRRVVLPVVTVLICVTLFVFIRKRRKHR